MTNEVLSQFGISGKCELFGNGHINTTYKIEDKYIVQKLNTEVFKDPCAVMNNIFLVTEYIRNKARERGLDPSKKTLEFLHTLDGKEFYRNELGVFRAYRYIDKAYAPSDEQKSPQVMYEAAKTIGEFQYMLSDFNAAKLADVIPDFHNTEKRLENLEKSVLENKSHRAGSVREEIAFVLSNRSLASLIINAVKDGSVPLRVSHNDTKLNNVLFEEGTDKGLCLIDLDTVMGGTYLYDFGDAMRIGGTYSAEDEKDLGKVRFDLELFGGFAKGYLESASEILTDGEKKLLFSSVVIMTLECGCRFLTDYIDGDVYFRTAYKEHNLVRARNQFALVKDMLSKKEEAEKIVVKYL